MTETERTLGVDLSASENKTACCLIEWTGERARVLQLRLGWDDADLLAAMSSRDRVGIDAPFGWPADFISAVTAHSRLEQWPGRGLDLPSAYRKRLMYRETDRHVADLIGRSALSVSSDRLGVTAMRCALLLDALALAGDSIDRSGTGRVIELYPAAAISRWGLEGQGVGYKDKKGAPMRERLLQLLTAPPLLLEMDENDAELCVRSDDAFDAVVASMVIRAHSRGCTALPSTEDERSAAKTEGWIMVPTPGSLSRLR